MQCLTHLHCWKPLVVEFAPRTCSNFLLAVVFLWRAYVAVYQAVAFASSAAGRGMWVAKIMVAFMLAFAMPSVAGTKDILSAFFGTAIRHCATTGGYATGAGLIS